MFALLRRTRRHESNATGTTQIRIQTIKIRLISFSGNSVNKSIFYLGLFVHHVFTFCPWRLHHAGRGGAWPAGQPEARSGSARPPRRGPVCGLLGQCSLGMGWTPAAAGQHRWHGCCQRRAREARARVRLGVA